MKSDYLIYGILIVVVAILGYTLRDLFAGSPAVVVQENGLVMKTTGSTNEGDVQIDLTPAGIANGKLTISFATNTHSVDMEQFDLKKITVLSYNGKNYAPVSAPKLSGHHNSGEIVFDLNEMPKSFKITIKGIPNVNERVYEWK